MTATAIPPTTRSPPAWHRRPVTGAAAAFGVYLLLALVLFGRALAAGRCLCLPSTTDAGSYAWAFEWWPHAVLHGVNPLFPKLIYAPEGINLAHAQMVPAAALLFAPVTAVAGPLFSTNLALLLSPVLAAFFAFLLCRRVTGAFVPSLFGGWLFGFSTYMLGQLAGHLNLTLVFPVPALAYLVLRRVQGDLSRFAFIALAALFMILLFGFSPEVFVSAGLFGALALLLAALLFGGEGRRRMRGPVGETAAALAVTTVLLSPYLYYVTKPGALPILPWRTEKFSADLLGYLVPTQLTGIGGRAFATTTQTFSAGFVEGGAYVGLPVLVMVVAGLLAGRRQAVTRLLGVLLGVALIWSFGARLHVAGDRLFPLPWVAVERAPVLGELIPVRMSLYVFLCAGVIAALWLSRPGRRAGPWLLAIAAVATLWPAMGTDTWLSRPAVPKLFTDAAYRSTLTAKDTVLILPIGIAGNGMLWQAQAHLRFKLAGGYVKPPEAPDPYKHEPIYLMLAWSATVPDAEAGVRSFLRSHRVTAIVLADDYAGRSVWLPVLERLNWVPRQIGGATLLRPGPTLPRRTATAGIRAAVAAYYQAFARGNGAGACGLLSPDRLVAVTGGSGDLAACRRVSTALSRNADIRAAADATRVTGVELEGARGEALLRTPGRGRQRVPVVRYGSAWRIDGPARP